MSASTDISALYKDFTDALTEVLAENAVGPARRGRLARARAAVKRPRFDCAVLILHHTRKGSRGSENSH